TRDDTADFVLAAQDIARRLGNSVEPFERDHLLVGGNLKYRISGGVNDRLAGLHMFFAKFLDDLSAARRKVAENSRHLRFADEAINDRFGKSVRISWKGAFQNDSGHLPMAGSGVLAIRFQRAFAKGAARFFNRFDSGKRAYVSETEALQVWQAQRPRLADVAERV